MSSVLTGTIEEIADQADRILKTVAETAYSNAQEWDSRVDCLIKLADGSVVGEMIRLDLATEQRIREAGIRLKRRRLGLPVALENELWAPIAIVRRTP